VSTIEPGWFKDPADPTTQRYWDGEGWLGDPLPADAVPPAGPPSVKAPPPVPMAPAADPTTPASPASPALSRDAPADTPSAPPGTRPWPGGYPVPSTPPGVPGPPAATSAAPPRPHGLTLAGPGARLAARLVDILAVTLLCVIANAWFAVLSWRAIQPAVEEAMRRMLVGDPNTADLPVPEQSFGTLILMMLLVTTAVWFAYEVPGTANSGQTLGKRLLRIKVVKLETDDRLGFGRAFRRWGRLGLPTLLWVCYGIGFLLQLLDCVFVLIDRPLNQALHDKAAATVVVRVPRGATPSPATSSHATTGGRHADPS
jgi:uncharacterized RDD family membrane protein YckC